MIDGQTPKPKIKYGNSDETAHEVVDYLQALPSSPRRFVLRPYNRFSTEFTEWWLIGSREWPAYACSKLFFRRLKHDLYTGFCVERVRRQAGLLIASDRALLEDKPPVLLAGVTNEASRCWRQV